MVFVTRLEPHDCIARLDAFNRSDPPGSPITDFRKKYYHENGKPMLSIDVHGVDFQVKVWSRATYESAHSYIPVDYNPIYLFNGTITEDNLNGGSVIRGSFAKSSQNLTAAVGVVMLLAVPPLIVLLGSMTGPLPDNPLTDPTLWAWYLLAIPVGAMLLYGTQISRGLVTNALKDILEAEVVAK